jgi:crotonobetainyl-CoA:carnitine CoA-transferase CaiB-like acyl-CoA transferase
MSTAGPPQGAQHRSAQGEGTPASTAGPPESLPRILGKVRVLDLTRVVAGPWCTQTLADLGADVLKIERPGEGDDTRKVGPYVTDAQGQATKDSAFFMGSNRGKRSVTVDIATPEGARLVRELALQCDVFIENYKVGALQKYGLDAASIRALNPRIIYCSVTGFGQDGPSAPRPAYDSVMQAMCGLMSTCGHPDGEPGAGPMRSAVPIADIFTGLYAAIGILAALMQRDQTGHGQCIDAAMVDVTTAINAHLALGYLMTGKVPQRQGNNNPITAPSEVFRASDGYFSMSAANVGQFASMLQALELDPAIDQDPRFASGMARIKHRRALHDILEARTVQQPVRHWIDRLSPRNVPCAPIYDMQQLFDDPHVRHRGLVMHLPHASGVDVPVLRSPLHLSDAPVQHRAPPMLGEHTDTVLRELLKRSESDIAQLRSAGVV